MIITAEFKQKLLPILVSRTVIFFFIMSLLLILLYVAGTVQGFIDSTQFSLLRLYTVSGIFLTITSVFGTLLDVVRFLKNNKIRYLFRACGYMLLVIFGVITVLAVMFIITISGGNTGS